LLKVAIFDTVCCVNQAPGAGLVPLQSGSYFVILQLGKLLW